MASIPLNDILYAAWAYEEKPRRTVSPAKQLRRIERREERRMTYSQRCTLALDQWRREHRG